MKPGLLAKTVLLLLAIFAGAAVAVHGLFGPALESAARAEMSAVASAGLEDSRALIEGRDLCSAERNRRQLLDLPFELTAGDPARTRGLVGAWAAEAGRTASRNVDLLTREFHERALAASGRRAAEFGTEFRHRALLGLLLLFAAILALHGAALARTVLSPLSRLLRATDRVAAGDLTASAGFSRADEVGRLGAAFDRMTENLRASRDEVEALNRGLTDRVREQTAELTARNRDLEEANERLRRTVDELRETRERLVHSETMASIGRLAGGVAHEFNNLLGGITGCAESAREESDPEAMRESLDVILKTARRACRITGNLLDFSRPPAREVRETDLSRLVEEALSLVGPEARTLGVEVRAGLPALPPVRVDPGQIHQVVLNLLTNALRAMPRGGVLTVSVAREGPDALVTVADTGVGIPRENLPHIFEPFFTTRGDSAEARGTGLGLSVSYSVVRAHGGAIEVASRPGEGSVFTVRLPAAGEGHP